MKLTIGAHEIATLLDRAPPGLRVLSLDCFDTLIWRTTHSPRDVFARIDHPGGAMQPRGWAEDSARSIREAECGAGEVTLQDIYRRIHPKADTVAIDTHVMQELGLEADHAFAFTPVVALMQAAKARGLAIVIVSDMYLTEAQLRAHITAAAGEAVMAMIDHVFVSAAHGVAKGNGLFDIMLSAVGVAPDAVLHLGDNPAADYIAAAKAGLHAVHFRQFDPGTAMRLRQEAVSAVLVDSRIQHSIPAHQLHRAQISLRQQTDPAYVLGHDVLGPIFQAFSSWLQEELAVMSARVGKPVRPLFMMRDGYLPLQVFSALFPDAGAQPIEISRMVAVRAGLYDDAAIEAYLHERLANLPIAALARHLSLFGPEVARFTQDESSAGRAAFARFVRRSDTKAKILKRGARFRDRLMAHLNAAGVAKGDAIMLVDLGYNGSAQNLVAPMLETQFGMTVAGRYLMLREEQVTGLDKRGMFDTRDHECRVLHAMSASVVVLEQLCNVEQGSTVDFTADGMPVREAADFKAAHNLVRTVAQQACLDFVRANDVAVHRWPAAATLDARIQGASAVLTRLLFLPNADETQLFQSFCYDANLGTDQVTALFDPAYAQDRLRQRGLLYVEEERRMYVAAEIRDKGLPLSMMMFASLRFGLDLRADDFDVGGIDVPVMLLGNTDQAVVPMTAWPTIDGYYRLTVPVGAGQFVPGVQLGQICEMVQIDSIAFQRVADIGTATTWASQDTRPVLDEMEEVAGGVFRASEGALVMVPPPPTTDPLALVLVFRPLVWRTNAATVPVQDQVRRQAA